MEKLNENDVILCTVKRIEKTTVFLEIDGYGQGTMIFSEVSPGRIRNIREYVVPNKKIVCKVLRIKDGHPELSLRRVKAKERDEVLETHKKEKILANVLKPVIKEKTPEILEKIKEKYQLAEFLDEARENPDLIETFVTKTQATELKKIFAEKKEKEKEVSKIIILKTNKESGLKDIKESLKTDEAKINYLGSSKFSILVKDKNYKNANSKLDKIIEVIKSKAKSSGIKFELKEK